MKVINFLLNHLVYLRGGELRGRQQEDRIPCAGLLRECNCWSAAEAGSFIQVSQMCAQEPSYLNHDSCPSESSSAAGWNQES